MLSASLITLTLAFTAAALPPKGKGQGQGLAQVYSSCHVPNHVALTFDDGPYKYLKDISDILTNAGAKGTFFFNGERWDCIYKPVNIEHMKYVYNAGHQIAAHTWRHANLTTLDYEDLEAEFFKLDLALKRILGIKAAFMRPPYGHYNDQVLKVAAANQQSVVMWDFDSLDDDGATARESKDLYNTQVGNFSLALNHETESTAYDVLPYAIDLLKSRGYQLVTVAECLNMDPYLSQGESETGTWSCQNHGGLRTLVGLLLQYWNGGWFYRY